MIEKWIDELKKSLGNKKQVEHDQNIDREFEKKWKKEDED